MLVKVLKPFPYAHDSLFTVGLEAGAIVNIDESVVEGLHAEGLIEEATDDDVVAALSGAEVVTPPVEIPEDWADLHWFKQRAIAAKLNGGAPVASKAAAIALIEAALNARG